MRSRTLLQGAVALAASLFVGGAAWAGITGTAHDFSGNGWGSTELCIFCHTPHNSNTTVVAAPLWNHAVTNATFTLYTSATLNATGLAAGGVSKLCLSCHDGTVAIDSYGTRTGTQLMTGSAKLGTDLTNDHPIGFTYDAALATADGALVTPASTSQVVANVPLFAGKLECATCHNVHDNTNDPFLRVSNAASALCLKCHNK